MSAQVLLAAEGGGFTPPGPSDFQLPALFLGVTKPMILLVLAAALVAVFFVASSRRAAVVPGKMQYAGEMAYGFVRNSIARDVIGSHDFLKFVPYLVALFFFILVNNVFGLVPFIQFPTFSHVGFVYPLAILTWLVYNGVGIARKGFVGYLNHQTVPAGIKGPMLLLLIPLEFASNILVRPVTLALRLFANMFAGHMVIVLFALGGEYLLLHTDQILYKPVGIIAWVLMIVLSFLELLVQVLQAYIFTLLTANYISGALAEDH
ncbi:F0F1 ATP synthase subunit A [Tenggerimyces flavus]|uniref:ATP synthase subunit a n=1 Tax=Tenggerimyces flavus TaxID=1708749 RepID=A0ABV7Y487_9ACTN|nr:F0F1 ATP synthase subunit A [Tenggerimyces flavus]MBM7790552.1 F-type H+-transporting ATPase subunit a [Tenggerimyces flavus]